MLTEKECKKILFDIGIKLGVSPRLIATRLLSEEDKNDIMSGELSIVELEATVDVWMACGMPDYAHGKNEPYVSEKNRLKVEKPFKNDENTSFEYKKPFVDYRTVDD